PVLPFSPYTTLFRSGTAGIFMVVIGTVLLGRFMALSGVPTTITEWIMGMGVSGVGVVIAVAVLYLVLGCFLDSIGLLLLTLPIVDRKSTRLNSSHVK